MYILFINSSRIYFLFLFFIFHSNAQFNNNNNNSSSSSSSSSSSNYKKKKNVVQPMSSKVLKPEPDRMVRPGKPQTAHFCGSFRLKNRSMGKKQGPV